MIDDSPEAWSHEIRDFLLGRLAKGQSSVPLPSPQTQRLQHAPIRRWWTFEGKRYPSINGTLSTRWLEVIRAVRLLERTFNPRLRLTERPDGSIDWGQTLARGPFGPNPEYVVRSSGVGLGAEEHAALQGWMRWIVAEWEPYARRFELAMPAAAREALDALAPRGREMRATVEQLRQWAHVARRSRWPLLRDLVAETLRAAFEPEALDHIPLPTKRSDLFELLCLVRIARRVGPRPDDVRWLDLELSGNKVTLEGTTCWYQQPLDRKAVLSSPDFEDGLAEVVPVFGLRVPQRIDVAIEFNPSRRGINGILVEAKSGGQGFNEAVAQLRVYRRTRPRSAGQRFLVWGIVEKSDSGAMTSAQLEWLRREIDQGTGDVWAFSEAESIGVVLELLGCGLDAPWRPTPTPV